jgi:hypothetical protein
LKEVSAQLQSQEKWYQVNIAYAIMLTRREDGEDLEDESKTCIIKTCVRLSPEKVDFIQSHLEKNGYTPPGCVQIREEIMKYTHLSHDDMDEAIITKITLIE